VSGAEITAYAAGLRGWLAAAGADLAGLNSLTAAAGNLATLADSAPKKITQADWNAAKSLWDTARNAFGATLTKALLGPLASVPGLAELSSDIGKVGEEGIQGGVDLGPIHLEISSALLIVQPPTFSDVAGTPEAVAIGPFQIGAINASMSSPFGGSSLPGGGSLMRLADGGYAGALQLPLGVVQVDATAALASIDGQPSILVIMGIEFLPPIQLSFGFSLDRVGGIVGINRRVNTDALRDAVRTGTAGDVLFAVSPPAAPFTLLAAADRLFPRNAGTFLVGPSLKLAWLSMGPEGSLMGVDLGVVIEIPTGKVVILGVARVAIPALPELLNLRLDVLGIIDPVEQLVSIDASLVDSHVLGVFSVYGDAAARFSWGNPGYVVVSIGGFYPGFNPEPAHLPALRHIGLAMENPIPVIEVRSEGYFAVTSNSVQLGGRWEVGISLGIEAHGFLQVDAIVQFRPFHFEAQASAGFDVSADGFSFASVTLNGVISGPGPIVIHGSLSIDVFLFSLSWDETFTLGSGPSDTLPAPPSLLDVVTAELNKAENIQAGSTGDSLVVLSPHPSAAGLAAIPPTGTLRVAQHRAPLGLLIDRVDGRPLAGPQGVKVTNGDSDIPERFSPGSYITLTQAEALNRPPFDLLPAGRIFSPADAALSHWEIPDSRQVTQIVIKNHTFVGAAEKASQGNLTGLASLVTAAGKPPAISDTTPLVSASQEVWTATGTATTFGSATAAHQYVRYASGVAQAAADAAAPLSLAGV
jgi:hypothetical protein